MGAGVGLVVLLSAAVWFGSGWFGSRPERRAPALRMRKPVVLNGEILYGVSLISDDFFRIDPRTGQATFIGKTGMGGDVEDLTFDPDGQIVAVCWDGRPRLFRINLETGKGLPFAEIQGETIPYKFVEGLATVGGTLYGSASADDSYCPDCANHLVKIDLATGKATEVGKFGDEFLNVEAIAYSPKYGLIGADIGTLVGPDFRTFHTKPALIRIDPETGRATKIGDLPPSEVRLVPNKINTILSPKGPFLAGLDFGPDDTLYAATLPTHFGGESLLLQVDPENAAIREIGATGADHLDGLLYFSPLRLPGFATEGQNRSTEK